MQNITFDIIVAATKDRGIGKDGSIPWKIPADLKFFKTTTTSTVVNGKINAVIMGRKTYFSIPEKYRPLSDRMNIVVSRDKTFLTLQTPHLWFVESFEAALELVNKMTSIESVYVIGGGEIYREAIKHPACSTIYCTEVRTKHKCDVFFPEIGDDFELVREGPIIEDNGEKFQFKTYDKVVKV